MHKWLAGWLAGSVDRDQEGKKKEERIEEGMMVGYMDG